MDTQLVNRLDAFRSIQTLRKDHGTVIDGRPMLKSTFDELDTKLQAADILVESLANRGNAYTKQKDADREEAAKLGAMLGSAAFALAVRTKNVFLQAQCKDWKTRSGLLRGNRELVVGRFGALLKVLHANEAALAPYDIKKEKIDEFAAKSNAFIQSLKDKAQAVNNQKDQTSGFDELVSDISALVNLQLTPIVNALAEDLPDFHKAYFTSRRVLKTVSASRSTGNPAVSEQKTMENSVVSARNMSSRQAAQSTESEGVHANNGASKSAMG